jgi:very-long-chain (3R)-3-hydroxyacyl-CoA dehydratase
VTALQVASRLWVLWGLVDAAPAATTARAVPLLPFRLPPPLPTPALSLATLLAAWCAAEVLRYAFFAAKELGVQPRLLLWARYSAFLVLYPLGISSELAMARLAIPALRASGKWSPALPNAANAEFAYWAACLAGVAVYAPGAPLLYGHMRSQRRKALGGGGERGGAARGARRAKAA